MSSILTRVRGTIALPLMTFAAMNAFAASIVSVTSGLQDGQPDINLLTQPLNGSGPSEFALHDHVYISPNIPDPDRGYVIFEFDTPVIVTDLTMIQHANGITKLDQYTGDMSNSLTFDGTALSSYGDITGSAIFPEASSDTFTSFGSIQYGTIHKFIIAKTSHASGYASYRWYLNFQAAPVPEPSTAAGLLLGLSVLALSTLRRQRIDNADIKR